MEPLHVNLISDSALQVTFGTSISAETHQHIIAFCRKLEKRPLQGIREWVPSYTAVTVFYDPLLLSPASLETYLLDTSKAVDGADHSDPVPVTIPVCYEEPFGPDLHHVANYNQLKPGDVIERHSEPDYLIHMMGFMPGFPYLGGMNKRIAAPRLGTPRRNVPAGSVGIAGTQTGVYPLESPGGWNIIGRTPKKLFFPSKTDPILLEAGMTIRFTPVSAQEFLDIEEKEASY
ncbi:5-oxoprolinase subunit PxpB [Salibacterium halotolerans]|uniref:5-oxoprolinase subunit PxpB n=1 Tax=Salibacterium halotolerans TaxID=1884432 RepID=UPI001FCD8F67|nr:5-oxoprolinase subunit PxpB [Salibacterium halotolerans]